MDTPLGSMGISSYHTLLSVLHLILVMALQLGLLWLAGCFEPSNIARGMGF
jgi:hypothetical protein